MILLGKEGEYRVKVFFAGGCKEEFLKIKNEAGSIDSFEGFTKHINNNW